MSIPILTSAKASWKNLVDSIRILGVDPGTLKTGYGLIEYSKKRTIYIASGCIKLNTNLTIHHVEKSGNTTTPFCFIFIICFIGMNQLEELVLGTAVMENFKGIPTDLIDINSFWKHSIGCALAARLIAEHIREPGKDRFFLLGILHDIGSLIIYKKAPKVAKKVLELSLFRYLLMSKP